MRRQLRVQQVGQVQIDELHAAQGLQAGLDLRLRLLELGSGAGNPEVAVLGQATRHDRSQIVGFSDAKLVEGEYSHRRTIVAAGGRRPAQSR